MWGIKKRFDRYVASQALVSHPVHGSQFSIKLMLDDIEKRGFSSILGKYVNEEKAVVEDRIAYIMPEYNQYQHKVRDYKAERLVQYVNHPNFVSMLNFATIVQYTPASQESAQYYFAVDQLTVRKCECMIIVALLMEAGLAIISNMDQKVYIIYNYQKKLEKTTKIQRDLSGFRVLLGESSNLNTLLNLIEEAEIKNGKIYISAEKVKDYDFTIEMMSLADVGMVQCIRDANMEDKFKLEPFFSSWLLEYISNTSDRISFVDWYAT